MICRSAFYTSRHQLISNRIQLNFTLRRPPFPCTRRIHRKAINKCKCSGYFDHPILMARDCLLRALPGDSEFQFLKLFWSGFIDGNFQSETFSESSIAQCELHRCNLGIPGAFKSAVRQHVLTLHYRRSHHTITVCKLIFGFINLRTFNFCPKSGANIATDCPFAWCLFVKFVKSFNISDISKYPLFGEEPSLSISVLSKSNLLLFNSVDSSLLPTIANCNSH